MERFGDRFGECLSERFGGSSDSMFYVSLVTGSVKGPKRGEIGKYGNMLKNEPRLFRIRFKLIQICYKDASLCRSFRVLTKALLNERQPF